MAACIAACMLSIPLAVHFPEKAALCLAVLTMSEMTCGGAGRRRGG